MISSVSLLGSKYAMTLALVRSSLICCKDCSCCSDQWNCLSFFVNSLNGADTSLNLGMNFAQYVAMPRKLRTPLAMVGAGAFLIASIFGGSDAIPLLENTNPKDVTGFVKLTFLLVECEIDFCELLAYLIKGCLCLPEDNDIITDVECTGNVSELVLNGLLKDLAVRGSAKVESIVPPESLVRCECGDVSTLGSK